MTLFYFSPCRSTDEFDKAQDQKRERLEERKGYRRHWRCSSKYGVRSPKFKGGRLGLVSVRSQY